MSKADYLPSSFNNKASSNSTNDNVFTTSSDNTGNVLAETKKINPSLFVITTLTRLLTQQTIKEERIKVLQKKKYIEELSSLQEKPKINPYSKKIVKNNQCRRNVSPLYIRTEIENQEKLKRLKDLQQKNDEKNQKKFLTECTFSPNSVESLTRNHEKFVNDCYA